MKITVKGSELSRAVGHVRSVVGKKGILQAVSCILLDATEPGVLELTGTDLSQSLTVRMPAEITDGAGTLMVPGDRFDALAKELTATEVVKLASSPTFTLAISGGTGKFTLAGLGPDEWPGVIVGQDAAYIGLNGSMLAEGLRGVEYAADRSEASGLSAVCIEASPIGTLELAATDRARLAFISVPRPGTEPLTHRMILPLDSARTIMALFAGTEAIKFQCDGSILTLTTETMQYSARLMATPFPNWQQMVPTAHPNTFEIQTKPMQEALRRVLLIHDDRPYQTVLHLKDEMVDVIAVSDAGSVEETVPATRITGEPMALTFNAKLVLDWLSHVPSGTFSLCAAAPNAGIVRFIATGAPGYLCSPIYTKGHSE